MGLRQIALALGVVYGLQALRAFLPLLVYVLRDRVGVSTVFLGLTALALFSLAFAIPRGLARSSPERALGGGLLGLAVARGALQLASGRPAIALVVAGAGVIAFLVFLGLWVAFLRWYF